MDTVLKDSNKITKSHHKEFAPGEFLMFVFTNLYLLRAANTQSMSHVAELKHMLLQ